MEYEKGKVYLRNKTNGQVYLYERHLAQHPDFESFIPNPVDEEVVDKAEEETAEE